MTIIAIAVSVTLLLGVERIRAEARNSFANTISGTDLVVGARGGSIQLLLYSVFRIGNATNNISWGSYREFADLPNVAWTIPFSLGDLHRGYRVLGTTPDYFKYYRYGEKRNLRFSNGDVFDDVFDAVLGADVAEKLAMGSATCWLSRMEFPSAAAQSMPTNLSASLHPRKDRDAGRSNDSCQSGGD